MAEPPEGEGEDDDVMAELAADLGALEEEEDEAEGRAMDEADANAAAKPQTVRTERAIVSLTNTWQLFLRKARSSAGIRLRDRRCGWSVSLSRSVLVTVSAGADTVGRAWVGGSTRGSARFFQSISSRIWLSWVDRA